MYPIKRNAMKPLKYRFLFGFGSRGVPVQIWARPFVYTVS
jgi:hypothetical protein